MSVVRESLPSWIRALALASIALALLARPLFAAGMAEEVSVPTNTAAPAPDTTDPAAVRPPPPPEVLALGPAYPPTSADSLLPATLGPMERLLWSEGGLMRRLGMPLTEDGRENEVFLRRNLLTAHQVGGFITLAAMTATAVTGQQIVNGRDDLENRKRLLVNTTLVSYFATAALALVTPPPTVRRNQWSSISWHKSLAVVHFTGMIITPFLGYTLENDDDVQILHQVSGYVTLAALTGAMLVVTF